MGHYITSGLVVLSLIGFYKLFEKIFPVSKGAYTSNRNFAALKADYVGYDFKQQGIFLLVTIVTGLMLVKILAWLLDFRLSFVPDQLIMVKPGAEMRYVISIFSAMLLAIPITLILAKQQLKENFTEYLAYTNLKYKFNAIKVMKYTIGVLAIIIALCLIAFFDWYSAFGKEEIKINGAFSLGAKKYGYSDIIKIKDVERLYAPNGNIVNDPHYVIEFADGKKWNSRDDGFENYEQNKRIIDLVRSKTSLEPIKLEFED
jgi:hypothetical protein